MQIVNAVKRLTPHDASSAPSILATMSKQHWLRSFSRDGITPVRNEMTWTSFISSGVKERRKQFWFVYIGVAIADT